MKAKHLIITSGVILGGVWLASGASALTYQDTETIEFTFNPTLEMSLSGTNINISNLAPGTSSTSSPITVTVNTNSVAGYTLSASVSSTGALTQASTDAKFASLGTSAKLSETGLQNYTLSGADGVWGCKASLPSGSGATISTNYVNVYSGLSSSGETIATSSSNSVNGGDTVNFAIGAKAANGMLAGDYSNTIVFQAVTNPTN